MFSSECFLDFLFQRMYYKQVAHVAGWFFSISSSLEAKAFFPPCIHSGLGEKNVILRDFLPLKSSLEIWFHP